jgi:hypothetical protein
VSPDLRTLIGVVVVTAIVMAWVGFGLHVAGEAAGRGLARAAPRWNA